MKQALNGWLLGLASFGACMACSAPVQAAPAEACAPAPEQGLDLPAFRRAAQAYTALLPRPEAASALLLCLQRAQPELAETLMLHQRPLRAAGPHGAALERAFLHYVVNTAGPRLGPQPDADLERLAQAYRQALLLPARPDADTEAACEPPPWTLARLRCIGQKSNHQRYGRDDVVPVDLLPFDSAASGYATPAATWMSELAALAYWDADLIGQQLGRWGFARVAGLADAGTDTSGFIASRDQVLVISFRGTSGLQNFLTDGNIRRVPAPWAAGSVHEGFKHALDTVWPQIKTALGPPQAQRRDLWLTGHSLGAALAQLAALRLTREGYRVRQVYTFGTPRIGDQDFVADYDRQLGTQSFPHVNARDVVARVPPLALGFRAAAAGTTRLFPGPGHELRQQSLEAADAPEAGGDWRSRVLKSISKTTEFLPSALRPAALRSAAPAAPPTANLYGTSFQRGPLDDHGSAEYLFKLVCASIEVDLWPLEQRQSAAGAAPVPRR
jgi:hypothetical protein